jgi:hypothetical protein
MLIRNSSKKNPLRYFAVVLVGRNIAYVKFPTELQMAAFIHEMVSCTLLVQVLYIYKSVHTGDPTFSLRAQRVK